MLPELPKRYITLDGTNIDFIEDEDHHDLEDEAYSNIFKAIALNSRLQTDEAESFNKLKTLVLALASTP